MVEKQIGQRQINADCRERMVRDGAGCEKFAVANSMLERYRHRKRERDCLAKELLSNGVCVCEK